MNPVGNEADARHAEEIEMTAIKRISWCAAAVVVIGIGLAAPACDGEDKGKRNDAGVSGTGGRASGGTGGSRSGGTGGNAGGGTGGRAAGGGTGGRTAGGSGGGFNLPDGGFSLDAFSFDGGGFDAAAIPECASGVSNGGNCTFGTDVACRPTSGGTLCACVLGTWTCF